MGGPLGAVVFEAAPGFARIGAARHPNDSEQAAALAAEIYDCQIDKADKQTPLRTVVQPLTAASSVAELKRK